MMDAIIAMFAFAIVLNMGFVYFAWRLVVLLEQFYSRLNITLSDMDGHLNGIYLTAKEIHKKLEEL